MITHCVCCDVSFQELKRLIDLHGAPDGQSLRQYVEFGTQCGLCLPYIARVFEEGKTAFEWRDDSLA